MNRFYITYGKRLCDLVVCFFSLVVLIPVFLVVALVIKFDDGGPVFFTQERVGRGFKNFKLIKFRTMRIDAPYNGPSITTKTDPRVTRVGRVLRKLKIDELPQVFNVIRGDMSVVGPRPEVPKYVSLFEQEYRKLLTVRPGMTGYASVLFRNEEQILARYSDPEIAYTSEILPQKIKLELSYVRRVNFFLDAKIFLWTFLKVFFG